MQPLRKTDIQAQPADADREATERVGPRPVGGDPATQSPALLLRDHLAARLDELAQLKAGDAAVLAVPAEPKLPVPARVAVIVGLSLSLWLALGLTAAAVL